MMRDDDGSLHVLTGGLRLKARVQHPKIIERTDRGGPYWYFRFRADERQSDGSTKAVRKFQRLGPSKGDNKLTKKQAELARDRFLSTINKATVEEKLAEGVALLAAVAEKYKDAFVNAEVAGHRLLAEPTRQKYLIHLEKRIVPKWGSKRLFEIRSDEVQQWLFETCDSWHMMNDLRGILSGIYTKAEEWGYWPEGKRSPISRVKIGEKWNVRPERILTWDETVRVLARLTDPNLLVIETAIATGARVSEILGLTWQYVDLQTGVLRIEQRNWRGDISKPKSKQSRRLLTLGTLLERYQIKAIADNAKATEWVFARTDRSGLPLWDSGVRQALKKAAEVEGCDFPGLGPHSFRRANITWRQEVGASSIEASKIAGHGTVRMTEEYTKIQIQRQEELTRAIQERLVAASEANKAARQDEGTSVVVQWPGQAPPATQTIQ